jgi:ATP/maltotriose-dependent transcriptional regulator MalT
MFKEYLDLQIQFATPTDDSYPVSVHAPGGDARGILVSPASNPAFQQLVERIDTFEADEKALNQIGQVLFQALFVGQIKEVYLLTRGQLREGQGLRVTLHIPPYEHEVASLPWELLVDPDRGPIAMLDTAIVRYLPQPLPIPVLALPQRIRVLLTSAQSREIQVDVARELATVQTALAGLGMHVQVVVEPHLTKMILQRRLREQFHVWHFVGQGSVTKDGKTGGLMLEDKAGDVDFVKADELHILLQRNSVRLVVLSAGESAKMMTNPLRSVAPTLIRAQVPAVVAMQFAVPKQVTHAFSSEFYRTLAEGFPIDACVTEGRKAIMNEVGLERPYWGVPILYTRAPTGRLFVPRGDMPPDPVSPPEGVELVGRAADLDYYAKKLTSSHMAIIAGPPGVGKTAVGAALTHCLGRPDKTFWHSFRERTDIDLFVRKLIEFLAWDGQDELWRRVRSTGQTGDHPLTAIEQIDHIIPLLRGRSYLLCLDDFQFVDVDGDSTMKYLTQQLCNEAIAGHLSLLITTWRVPPTFVLREQFKPLDGLAVDMVGQLLCGERFGVSLDPELITKLHAATHGNAQFVTLAGNAIKEGADPARLIDELAQTGGNVQQIAVMLSDRVDRFLSPDQRAVLKALAILDGFGTADAIEATLDASESVQPPLLDLLSRNLLTLSKHKGGDQYSQHGFLRTFYYSRLVRGERLAMHRQSAAYFTPSRAARLRAAWHFMRGEDFAHSVRLATDDVWLIINQGRARELLAFLQTFTPDQLDRAQWAAICTAIGEVHALLAEFEPAQTWLRQALQHGAPLAGDTAQIEAQAARYRLLALVGGRTGDFDRAEASCVQGLNLVAPLGQPNVEAARLYAQLAEIRLRRGSYDDAEQACHDGLALLPGGPDAPRERINLLQRLGSIHGDRGMYTEAAAVLEQSLAFARSIDDPYLTAVILHNLARSCYYLGQNNQALIYFQESLQLKEQIGDISGRILTINALGAVYQAKGDNETALHWYSEAQDFSRRLGLPDLLARAMLNIGLVYYEQSRLNLALKNLKQAQALAVELDDPNMSAHCLYILGDIALMRRSSGTALRYGRQALALARRIKSPVFEACALRVVGEALLMKGRLDEAALSLAQARQVHEQVGDPYDLLLIQAAQARLALAQDNQLAATSHAQVALALAQEQQLPHLITALEALQRQIDDEQRSRDAVA